MSKFKYSGILFFVLFFMSCLSEEKTTRTVEAVNSKESVPADAIIYSLPRSVIKIDVLTEKIINKRGPLADYGKRYLGLEGGVKEDNTEWTFKVQNVLSYEESDPDQYYMIRSNGLVNSNFLQLSENGLVLMPAYGESGYTSLMSDEELEEELDDEVYFKDMTVKPYHMESSDTVYSLIETDTGFVKVPHVQLKSRFKNLNEKAAEAAAFIIKIRKRRFKLLSGQYDVFPEGIALQYAVNELTRLENEYLSLFIGKTIKKQFNQSFEYIPDGTKAEQTDVLFRFSSSKGILAVNDLTGSPVSIKVKKQNQDDPIKSMNLNNNNADISELIYRVPVPCLVELNDETLTLGKSKLFIYQLGPVVRLPDNVDLSPEEGK